MKITLIDEDTGHERTTTLGKFLELEILREVSAGDVTEFLCSPPTVYEIRIARIVSLCIERMAESGAIRQRDIQYYVIQLRDLL